MNEEALEALLKLVGTQSERIEQLDERLMNATSDIRALSLAVTLLAHSQKPVLDVVKNAAAEMVERDPIEYSHVLRNSFRSTLSIDV